MKPIHVYSAHQISTRKLPGVSAVLQFADTEHDIPRIADPIRGHAYAVKAWLCHDTADGPTAADAKSIAEFIRYAEAEPYIHHIVCQCQAGVGRSVAVAAAIAASRGEVWHDMRVYNRTLYRLLLAEFGRAPVPEPSVALAVRVKYDAETLMGFLISLRKQRYDNWQAVLFTDGPRADIRQLVESFPDGKLVLMETPESKGRWGHPYRQQALDICLQSGAEWIGTNNDDNYLTPGYIEQLVMAGTRSQAKLAICSASHRYSAWGPCKAGLDLACWLAHRSLIEQAKWEGTDFFADQTYFNKLVDITKGNVAEVPRVLVVKN